MRIDNKDIGEMLLIKRRDLGMTQSDLAERIGTTRQTIARIENGEFGSIAFSTFEKALNCLGYSLEIERGFRAG